MRSAIGCAAALCLAATCVAAPDYVGERAGLVQIAAADAPIYVPPVRGAPARRVGGASRGVESAGPSLHALVPEHVGLTIAEQPVLYWYLSKSTRVKIEITLIDEKGVTPVFEVPIESAQGPQIHALSLAEHNVRLRPGIDYQWTVSLVPDPAARSSDVVSGGAIRRVARPSELPPNPDAAAYAAAGLWYDALEALGRRIVLEPSNRALREQRAALLEQAQLDEVAAFERR